jgi:protein ImuA
MQVRQIMNGGDKENIIATLRGDIMKLQGFKKPEVGGVDPGLGPINASFPNHTFPKGAIHEFLANSPEDTAATCGFISGLLGFLAGEYGTVFWIGNSKTVFPPALKNFGVKPENVFFIDPRTQQHSLWAMEEALKCKAISAVVAEIRDLSFMTSRRLQLAVEESQVTGFVLRRNSKALNTTASVSKWRITSLPSEPIDNLPGLGYPSWRVELMRIRNGNPGIWEIKWTPSGFQPVLNEKTVFSIHTQTQNRKVG